MSNTTLTSLTAPWDVKNTTPQTHKEGTPLPPLSKEEVKDATTELVSKSYLQVDRRYVDPVYKNQMFCIHSFTPSQGATPDEHGVFGFMKCRGTYASEDKAAKRCEKIIRDQDSYHPLQISHCGRPFPVCEDPEKFAADTSEIDISKEATNTISKDIRKKRDEEKKVMEQIEERRKNLTKTVEDENKSPEDQYIMLRVKRADLMHKYAQTQDELVKIQNLIKACHKEIKQADAIHPEFKDYFFDKYKAARLEVGIKTEDIEDSFIKYMNDDIKLDFDMDSSDEEKKE